MPKLTSERRHKVFCLLTGLFLAASLVILLLLGFFIGYQDKQEAYHDAEETVDFLKTECQKYDNYAAGISARARQDMLDKATEIKDFFPPASLEDSSVLSTVIRNEHMGGILVLDDQLQPLAQADMDHQDSYAMWKDTLTQTVAQDILSYPKKTYVGSATVNDTPYDFAMTATDDGSHLILSYASAVKPATDPYELTIRSILTNNTFHRDPTVVITDGTKILSTNNEILDGLGTEEYQTLSSSIHWDPDQLTRFQYGDTVWYGLRRVYGQYFVYAAYPSGEVFSNRKNFITFAFMGYLTVCVLLLFVQRRTDKATLRKLEKQLRIIRAISTGYASTFLVHLDRMVLEPMKASQRLKDAVKVHPRPRDFLNYVCQHEVAPAFRGLCADFLDFETMAKRVQGHAYLGREFQDIHGTWYSVLIIPQRFDEGGRVRAVLITTRDVTTIKQAEELSFKDKLTGLHNRNYVESRSKNFIRAGDLPVSLIMADCNYLKRTNDTLGHEYGDLLLQRVAAILKESVPKDGIAIRVGGDEFLLLCPHCTHAEAERLIARIKQSLAERSDETLTLSVSFGISTTDSGEFSFSQAYEEADQEMYRDKQASHTGR